MDELVNKDESEDKGGIPWENRSELGVFKALFASIKEIIAGPSSFFQKVHSEGPISTPYLFYFIITIVVSIITLMYQSMWINMMSGNFASLVGGEMPFGMGVLAIFTLVVVSVSIFISAAFMHLFVLMLGGKGGYKGTFCVLCYSAAVTVFAVIPFLGGMIAAIWSIVLGIIGYKHIHKMSTIRAVFAYFLIYFLVFGLVIISLIAAIAIPNLLRAKGNADTALATSTLRTLSVAAETYVTANGEYPSSVQDLTEAIPPYIAEDYCEAIYYGYYYSCNFGPDGYEIMAIPSDSESMNETYTIMTGGVMTP